MNTYAKWSIGSATGTIFKDDHPTGSEVRVFNLNHGSPQELIEQANKVPALLTANARLGQENKELRAALEHAYDAINAMNIQHQACLDGSCTCYDDPDGTCVSCSKSGKLSAVAERELVAIITALRPADYNASNAASVGLGDGPFPGSEWRLLELNEVIEKGDQPFDLYAGWMESDGYHATNRRHAYPEGRWIAWRRLRPADSPQVKEKS